MPHGLGDGTIKGITDYFLTITLKSSHIEILHIEMAADVDPRWFQVPQPETNSKSPLLHTSQL